MNDRDVTHRKLRHAVRLVHCLQKERGASASYFSHQISNALPAPPAPIATGIGALLEAEENMKQKASSKDNQNCLDEELLSTAVFKSRKHTNVAFKMVDKADSWISSLDRVRNKIDESCHPHLRTTRNLDESHHTAYSIGSAASISDSGKEKNIGPHRVVIMFNILIGNIIDECITAVIQKKLNTLNRVYGALNTTIDQKKSPMLRPKCHSRFRSQEFLIAKDSPPLDTQNKEKHRRSSTLGIGMSAMARSLPIDTSDDDKNELLIQQLNINGLPPPSLADDGAMSRTLDVRKMMISCDTPQKNEIMKSNSSSHLASFHIGEDVPINFSDDSDNLPSGLDALQTTSIVSSKTATQTLEAPARRVQNLLSLLLSFVRLKESTGAERAILSSLMALSSDSAGEKSEEIISKSSRKLFSDLVVEEANQRRIIKELQDDVQTNEIEPSLLRMVDKFLTPSPKMREVQEKIKNFDLADLHQSMPLSDFWDMITLYIDELHALELMLIEDFRMYSLELAFAKEQVEEDENLTVNAGLSVSPTKTSDEVMKTIIDSEMLPDSETIQHLVKMSAEDVKKFLLQYVQGDELEGKVHNSPESSSAKESGKKDGSKSHDMIRPVAPDHNLQEWEIDLYEIDFRQRIGTGVGGTTYLARWSGQEVAVKVSANTDIGLEAWYTEINSLKRLHHPNVIRLLGAVYNPSPPTYGLVLEYCNAGDLSEALKHPTPPNFFWKIADDVANGMNYLHKKQIIHRDIKPANVLLHGDIATGSFTAKLTDFGVAILHESQAGEEHTAETGTYRWMAPEVIRHESYSLMADVYSYSVLLWQLCTHEIPFQHLSQLEAAGKVAIEDARPILPRSIPDLIRALIERCWSVNPDDRLPFSQITIELKEIHKVLSEKEKEWLKCPIGHVVYDESLAQHRRNSLMASMSFRSERPNGSMDKGSKRSILGRSKSPRRDRDQKPRRKRSNSGLFSIFRK
ncbi:mitogen-activated protein kinase kinase kinase 9 [Chaetoceros tenuissimus]|uniref:Mitogen-activated protein kinase kinase kinase 9 n=1 Tax=Chaetoceros tenuissimus TaxID=426638 RepID=A0AAD3H005_9STRA|nr:mitogen-activated protein kinase kinase kinase 9 [Chaetoceros tenuissimus]